MIMRRLHVIAAKREPRNGLALGLIVSGPPQSAVKVAGVSYLVAAVILAGLQQRGKQA